MHAVSLALKDFSTRLLVLVGAGRSGASRTHPKTLIIIFIWGNWPPDLFEFVGALNGEVLFNDYQRHDLSNCSMLLVVERSKKLIAIDVLSVPQSFPNRPYL